MMHLSDKNSRSDIDKLESIAAQRCLKENVEFTSLRRRVFREIASHGGTIGAYDIASHISTAERRINVASVYRALDFLVEAGFVRRIKTSRTFALADLETPPKKDAMSISFFCRNSGVVKEIQSPLITAVLKDAAKSVGFNNLSALIEVEGVFSPKDTD